MGIVIRQSFWNSAISYVGVVLGAINIIWLFPAILGQEQFGLTRLLLAGSMVAAQFAQLGMGNVTFRFFPLFQNAGNGHNGFLRPILGIPLLGLAACILLFFAGRPFITSGYAENSPLFVEYDIFLLPLLAFTLYFNVLDAWLRSVYRTVAGSFLREVLLRLFQALTVLAYGAGWLDFAAFVAAFVAVHGLQTALLFWWTIRSGEFEIRTPYTPVNGSVNREMAHYGFFAILGGISAIVLSQLDILMIGSMIGEDMVAVYAVAFYIGTFITIPERSISKISYPLIAQAFKDENMATVKSLYQKTALNQTVIGLLIFVGIWANAENAITILPDNYALARNVMIIITAAKLVDMATGANGIVLLSSRWYRFDLVTNVFLVIFTIFTNWMLIPRFGLEGAAWATLITLFVYNALKFAFIWQKMRIQPFHVGALKAIFAAGVAALASWFLPQVTTVVYIDILVRSVLITLIYSALILWWNASPDISQLVQSVLKRTRANGNK